MIGFDVSGVETINRGAGRVNRMREAFRGSPRTVLRRAGERVLEAMKENIPVAEEDENWVRKNRDHARDRIDFVIHGGDEGTFEGPDYLKYVIQGSEEHTVTPQNGLALSFFIGGQLVAAASADIPARSPNDFRIQAWDDSRSDVNSIMHDVGMKIVHGESEVE